MLKSFSRVRPDFARQTAQTLALKPPNRESQWVIGGMMGSGKTALAKRLASTWDISHIEIDRFTSPEEVTRFTLSLPGGWVAEANPWQVPEAVWEHADWTIFLDFDNAVNYWRLLKRGLERWSSSDHRWSGFRKHIIEDVLRDWYRLVYLYGEANRSGWRRNGMDGGSARAMERCLRCISPKEVEALMNLVHSYLPPEPP